MLLTKKGLKLWGSGLLVLVMSALFSEAMSALTLDEMSLWELGFILFVLFPLILGWVQRWYWMRRVDDVSAEL